MSALSESSTVRTRWWPDFRRPRNMAAFVVGLLTVVIFVVMQPWEIFKDTTPTGGDMGAHVLVPAYLRDVLLPEGRIAGWSNDWFAGFPILYFYFPLPAFLIVALDVIMPYGVAFKLVAVGGLLLMPIGSYVLAKGIGASRPIATVAAAAGAGFVFLESYAIFGGNIKSTMAGEYSFSWSMAFSLIYLGFVIDDARRGNGFRARSALALAAMALSHIITTMLVAPASLLLLRYPNRTGRIVTWLAGFALSAFWTIPLLTNIGYTTDMNWVPLRFFGSPEAGGPLPTELWLILPLAVAGVAVAVWKRYTIAPLLVIGLVPVIVFPFLEGKLWNGRWLPYFFFMITFFTGIAVGAAAVSVARRWFGAPRSWAWITLAAAATTFLPFIIGSQSAPGWANWNFSGYEAKPAYAEYDALMNTIDGLPPGRVMWEANSELNRYGTPMALMLTPFWSEGHPSMEGLLFESSLSTPFHFLNAAEMSIAPSNPIPGLPYNGFDLDRALSRMDLFNVSYYVTFTEEATTAALNHPEYELLATSDPFSIFGLPQSELVEVAEFEPVVFEAQDIGIVDRARTLIADPHLVDFEQVAVQWYADPENAKYWVAEDGPPAWRRIDENLAGLRDAPPLAADGLVSNIVLEDHRVSFSTTAIGVPHLVKVSYFPNWDASGASGPYRVAPAFMVVIPTQEQVELSFRRTDAETGGAALTLAALVVVLVGAVWEDRRQKSSV